MRLEKLTEKNLKEIAQKRIYCFEKSEAYLEELNLQFPIIEKIAGVIDENKRNQGSFLFQGREIFVESTAKINQIDWRESALLITSDYYKEVYDKICSLPDICNRLDRVFFFANHETERELLYREQYQNSQLENIIIFRSGPHASSYVRGMDFADNARALFEYMLANHYNTKYELVWLVKYPASFERYEKFPNVRFISFDWSTSEKKEERDIYYHYLCLAKYIFFTDAYGFARNCRKDQIRVQLWHGCGFKTRVNFVRCERRYEYTTVISELYAKIHAQIYGLREDQILITGYAKEDWLFHPISEKKLFAIGIPKADKYVFWLPTFRSTEKKLEQLNEYCIDSQVGLPIIDTYDKLQEVNRILQERNMVLIIKLHPFQDTRTVHCEGMTNICLLDNMQLVRQDIQINQLLGYADALISDYSSAAVDYLLLDRPMAFTLDDVEEYKNSRGFVFEDIKNWLPGKEVYDWMDFLQFITDIGAGVNVEQAKRGKIKKEMHNFSDDGSCQRIINALNI